MKANQVVVVFFIFTLASFPVSSTYGQTKDFKETKRKAEKGDAAAQYKKGVRKGVSS